MGRPTLTHAAWLDAAEDRYGKNAKTWRFRCPVCGVETAVQEWKDAGATEGAVAFSCIGRFLATEPRDALTGTGRGPCNYTGGGLLKLNPVRVLDDECREHQVFDFADRPLCEEAEAA